jgi:hypothetical protein
MESIIVRTNYQPAWSYVVLFYPDWIINMGMGTQRLKKMMRWETKKIMLINVGNVMGSDI